MIPGLSLADELKSRGHQVEFAGGRRLEATLVREAGYRLHTIPGSALKRSSALGATKAVSVLSASTASCLSLIARHRFSGVVGMGGYHTPGVAWAARALRRRVVLHEQNAVLSLSNRLAFRFADGVALSLPLSAAPPSSRADLRICGNPLRTEVKSIWSLGDAERIERRSVENIQFGFDPERVTLLVIGGSLGSKPINDAMYSASEVLRNVNVLHLAGADHAEAARSEWTKRGIVHKVFGYLPEVHRAYLAADVCVARSGGMIAELCVAGLPSILVPGPWATYDHQTQNAKYLQDNGAGVWIAQDDDLDAKLKSELRNLLNNTSARVSMAANARKLAKPDAAACIADLVEGLNPDS